MEWTSWVSLSGEALLWASLEQPPTSPVLPPTHGPAKPSQIPLRAALGTLPYFMDEEREARCGAALCLSPPGVMESMPHPPGPSAQPRSPC